MDDLGGCIRAQKRCGCIRAQGAWLKVTLGGNAAQIIDDESKKKVEEDGKVFNLSVRLHRQTRS
jgi:hypothetical protein